MARPPQSTDRQRRRSLDRIELICAAESNPKTLRARVLDEVRSVVAFDHHVWLLTDPRTAVGCAPLADVPTLRDLPSLVKYKYLTEVNRWTRLAADGPVARSLVEGTAGDLDASSLWREVLCRYGIRDVASVVFDDRHGCWAFLDLWRGAASDLFDESDCEFLAALAPGVTQALRRCQSATFGGPAVAQRRDLGPVVLLLDEDLNVVSQTPAAQEWLHVLVPRVADRPVVPASAYNVAGQLLALEAGIDTHEAVARVHLTAGYWVTLRAARIDTARTGTAADGGPAAIAVTLEETSASDRLDVFVRSFALTPRESHVVTLLATGVDTHQLATLLVVSEHTVQDHLKSIFGKTGARTRNTLLSRALGTQPS